MAKRKKSSVFNDDNDVDEGENSFKNYIREKADRSKKRAKDSSANFNIAENEISDNELSSSVGPDELETSRSKYMHQLLESKKRRELDKLHAQSVKIKLERKLEGFEDAEEIVTDGYRQKKEKYEQADELAKDEQDKEAIDNQNSIFGAEGIALKTIAAEMSPNSYQHPVDFYERYSKPVEIHHSNDVYINKSVKSRLIWEKQDDLNPLQKQECVRKFLQPTKTKQDIDILIKQYLERHHNVNN